MSFFKDMIKKAVGKDQYTDFSKDPEWTLEPSEQELKGAIKDIENKRNFITWVQSFSKKTVTVLFMLYIVCTLFSIAAMTLSYLLIGESSVSLDTFITENNQTFRVVIGGYLIKAAVENGLKISGNYYLGISNARLELLKKKLNLTFENPDVDTTDIDEDIETLATDEEEYRANASDT